MTLGEKIKKARIENGLTQEQLSEKMMVSRQAITKWEADKGIPDVSNLTHCF
jgi:transcriptional regulator with XRE-family HTH domain